jgi:uncharacterized protein GlcG (DUF336 family)
VVKRAVRRRNLQSEQLERKLLLGSLTGTDTGTLAGGLLPIETADLLSQTQLADLAPSDLALLEYEAGVEAMRSHLQHVEESDAETATSVSEVERLAIALQLQQTQAEAAAESEERDARPAESVQPEHVARALEQAEQFALLGSNVEPQDVAADVDEAVETDGDEVTDSDADSDEDDEAAAEFVATDDSEEAIRKLREALEADDSGRTFTQAVDLTFASGAGPSAQVVSGLASAIAASVARSTAAAATSGSLASSTDGSASGSDTGGSQAAVGTETVAGTTTVSSQTNADTQFVNGPNGQMQDSQEPVVIRYAFSEEFAGYRNEITPEEQAATVDTLLKLQAATDDNLQFVHDPDAADSERLTIFKGPLEAAGFESSRGDVLAVGGSVELQSEDGSSHIQNLIVLDHSETFDTVSGNGDPEGTIDLGTVIAHETLHVLGLDDAPVPIKGDLRSGVYHEELGDDAIASVVAEIDLVAHARESAESPSAHGLHAMITGYPQLSAAEVEQILDYATTVTPSDDAIIAIVDRGGNILGVRVEDGVVANFDSTANTVTSGNGNGMIDPASAEQDTLVFAIDGAVAKARTAAFFANGDPVNGTFAPITSRLVRFISQSTITHREVNSNPNSTDPFVRGPGLVAPIGVGGHFPPEIPWTPPVDLFHIETTNRDSLLHPGADHIKGTGDDITLANRFNIDPAFVPIDTDGDGLDDNPDVDMNGIADSLRISAPESYGFVSGIDPTAQGRGIATLPGGVPIYRDTNADGIGETIIGGIGVFFPGDDGTALFEQSYQPGQSEFERTNAPKSLEAEFIAVVAAGGSVGANAQAPGAKPGNHPVQDLDIPFGRLDLVGIQLQVIGRTAGIRGVQQLLQDAPRIVADQGLDPADLLSPANLNGSNQIVTGGGDFTVDGQTVPHGWLVTPHDGGDFDGTPGPDITAAEVEQIIMDGIEEAEKVRAAIRLPLGSRTRMVFAVADESGEVLGLYRMRDATVFSIEVAVSKARNTAYYASAADISPIDQVVGQNGDVVPAGTAFTNRTFRFMAEPRFPSGQEGTIPGSFSILHDIVDADPGLSFSDPATRIVESATPIPFTDFDTVLGFNSFNPSSNFRDADNVENQSGVVFFPGSTPLYGTSGALVGGFGVSGDGVDQDDVVTFVGAGSFLPPDAIVEADEVFVDGIRLPYQKFLRNPRG